MSETTPPRLLGSSPALDSVRRLLKRAAAVDVPVVLEGETGTGKSLAARWIHHRSRRGHRPFVSVNCAGIPEGLFESELFGHRKGAFTGAVESRSGLFEAASGGTLFLDEVGELPKGQQAKLLTVLEEARVRRVGDVEPRDVDVRVVAATSRDLGRAVRERTFRADLFHRLAVLRCALPPLRDRGDDLELLAREFLGALGAKHLSRPGTLTPAALERLRAHPWPGNVRELAHVLEAALILAGRRRLDRRHLEEVLHAPSPEVGEDSPAPGGPEREDRETPEGQGRYSFYGTEEEERAMIVEALERFRGNRTRTAEQLGMSRNTLRKRMREYGI